MSGGLDPNLFASLARAYSGGLNAPAGPEDVDKIPSVDATGKNFRYIVPPARTSMQVWSGGAYTTDSPAYIGTVIVVSDAAMPAFAFAGLEEGAAPQFNAQAFLTRDHTSGANAWDAKSHKVSHVTAGTASDDAATVGQTLQKSGGQMSGAIDANGHAVHNVCSYKQTGTITTDAITTILSVPLSPVTEVQLHLTVRLIVVITKDSDTSVNGSIECVSDWSIAFDGSGFFIPILMGAFTTDTSRLPAELASAVLAVDVGVNTFNFKLIRPAGVDLRFVAYYSRNFIEDVT